MQTILYRQYTKLFLLWLALVGRDGLIIQDMEQVGLNTRLRPYLQE
jgi:hypothetical protein